jgi:hypothetical protein
MASRLLHAILFASPGWITRLSHQRRLLFSVSGMKASDIRLQTIGLALQTICLAKISLLRRRLVLFGRSAKAFPFGLPSTTF